MRDDAHAPVDPVIDKIVRAAFACVARHGFDGMTIDDIVRESGVPRTTVYRKVGNRGAVLRALLNWMAQPRIELCRAIAMSTDSLAERTIRVISSNIASIAEYPWLHAMLCKGVSHETLALFRSMDMEVSRRVLRPMLEGAAESGAWVPPTGIDELLDWVVRQTLLLGGEENLDEALMRERVRIFIAPVFGFDRDTGSIEKRLADVEARLDATPRQPGQRTRKAA